jgi:hypothetical protein
MFRIFSQNDIDRCLRLRRWQALALFAAGIALGTALDRGEGFPPNAHAQDAAPVQAAIAHCTDDTRLTLRLACSLNAADKPRGSIP